MFDSVLNTPLLVITSLILQRCTIITANNLVKILPLPDGETSDIGKQRRDNCVICQEMKSVVYFPCKNNLTFR